EVYVAYFITSSMGVWLKRSFDGGNTFDTVQAATRLDTWALTGDCPRMAGTFRAPQFNYLAVDPNNGTLYMVYFDRTNSDSNGANINIYFTKSTAQGATGTWSVPRVINGDSTPAGDQFFPWIEVDSHSRIHMVFLDSRGIVQLDSATHGRYNAYYSYSDDA